MIAQDSAQACQMRGRGLAHAAFAASEENEFGPAHKTLRSKALIMICWADITLPSSRVRSDAFWALFLTRTIPFVMFYVPLIASQAII